MAVNRGQSQFNAKFGGIAAQNDVLLLYQAAGQVREDKGRFIMLVPIHSQLPLLEGERARLHVFQAQAQIHFRCRNLGDMGGIRSAAPTADHNRWHNVRESQCQLIGVGVLRFERGVLETVKSLVVRETVLSSQAGTAVALRSILSFRHDPSSCQVRS